MANEVVMPRLGWTMEVGRVVEWLKADGEPVQAGEPIFSVESDKSVTEVEALDAGVLRIPPDDSVGVELPVGATLAYITAPGEQAPFELAGAAPAAAGVTVAAEAVNEMAAEPVAAAVASGGADAAASRRAISPRARKLARDLGIDWATITGGGMTGRIRERDVLAAAERPREAATTPRATPVVRRLAEERGVELAAIDASGPAGRVTRADVARAAANGSANGAAHGSTAHPAPVSAGSLAGPRRVVFERMAEAARTVAPVTLHHPVDATDLCRLRDRLKADIGDDGPIPTYDDLFIRLVALMLRRHPALNASFLDGAIATHDHVAVAFAVDAGDALYAPVVRDADRKSVHAIAEETAALVAASRAGTLAPDDARGGTFTITNLGMHGIDAFTPIVNLPDAAVLGIGAIRPTPVVIDEEAGTFAVRRMMTLSLTFDHRIVDGAPAARFLHALAGAIERPLRWLTM